MFTCPVQQVGSHLMRHVVFAHAAWTRIIVSLYAWEGNKSFNDMWSRLFSSLLGKWYTQHSLLFDIIPRQLDPFAGVLAEGNTNNSGPQRKRSLRSNIGLTRTLNIQPHADS